MAPMAPGLPDNAPGGMWIAAGGLPGPRAPSRRPRAAKRHDMQHQSFLEYKRYRYLKLAVALCLGCTLAYGWHRSTEFATPGGLGYGGTLMGYALGTIGALLIVWLMLLGARKRSYGASRTTLQGWLSAHVYLGFALLVIATLHTGLELGLNLHALVYFLLLAVVLSGLYGVVMFLRVPTAITDTMGDDSVQTLMLQLRDLDQQARRAALRLPDEFNALAVDAAEKTRLRGTVFDHITHATSRGCPTTRAVRRMRELTPGLRDEAARQGRELLAVMVARRSVVERIRTQYRLLARMRLWLLLHVPLSVALLCALAAHIVSVFIYW